MEPNLLLIGSDNQREKDRRRDKERVRLRGNRDRKRRRERKIGKIGEKRLRKGENWQKTSSLHKLNRTQQKRSLRNFLCVNLGSERNTSLPV